MQLWITAWETSSPCAPAWKPWGSRQKLPERPTVCAPPTGSFCPVSAPLPTPKPSWTPPVLFRCCGRKPPANPFWGSVWACSCFLTAALNTANLVGGEVAALREDLDDPTLKVPHMGWNRLEILRDDPLFRYFQSGEHVYYVHSFYARHCAEDTLAVSHYGNVAVTGVVRRGKVYGAQFHPEKSGDAGLRLLKAFGEL